MPVLQRTEKAAKVTNECSASMRFSMAARGAL
jgi:hypothetical protein